MGSKFFITPSAGDTKNQFSCVCSCKQQLSGDIEFVNLATFAQIDDRCRVRLVVVVVLFCLLALVLFIPGFHFHIFLFRVSQTTVDMISLQCVRT